MNHGNFCKILGMIEPYITPKDILGATEVIKAPERLALTIRFLATGETYHYHLVKCSICLNSQWIRWAAQHVERCCANALDFVEPHMDDRERKEMLSRVERKV